MPTTPTVRKHLTQVQREKILKAYRSSQLTQREFAAQAGISLSTLQLWLRQASTRSVSPPGTFVQVPNLLAQTQPAPLYRLQLAGGIQLELSGGFAAEEVAVLLQLLLPAQ